MYLYLFKMRHWEHSVLYGLNQTINTRQVLLMEGYCSRSNTPKFEPHVQDDTGFCASVPSQKKNRKKKQRCKFVSICRSCWILDSLSQTSLAPYVALASGETGPCIMIYSPANLRWQWLALIGTTAEGPKHTAGANPSSCRYGNSEARQ